MRLLNPLVVNPTALITYYLLPITYNQGTMDDFGEGIESAKGNNRSTSPKTTPDRWRTESHGLAVAF